MSGRYLHIRGQSQIIFPKPLLASIVIVDSNPKESFQREEILVVRKHIKLSLASHQLHRNTFKLSPSYAYLFHSSSSHNHLCNHWYKTIVGANEKDKFLALMGDLEINK
jgi:hypothetical protein